MKKRFSGIKSIWKHVEEIAIELEEKDDETIAGKIRRLKEVSLPKTRKTRTRTIIMLVLLLLLIIILGIGIFWAKEDLTNKQTCSFAFMTFGVALFAGIEVSALIDSSTKIRSYEEQLRQAEDEFDLLEIAEGDNVKRSEKLFRNHQKELKRYYDINLGHYRWIFPVGVMTVILGSAIVGSTIWLFRGAIKDSIAPILIGAVSGVLVDFIGAVLIHMYTETVKSSIAFHSQLMKSNHALFANMLAFKIEDPVKHDETFAELAKLMIQSNVEAKK